MLIKLDQESEICKAYRLANPVPYAEREIPNDILQLIEKQKVVPRAQGKRKTTPTATSSPKPKRTKKSKSKPILRDEDSDIESDPNIRKVQTPHSSPHKSISEPFSTAPITTSITEPIPTSPLKTPTTTEPITTTTSTPDYTEQLNAPFVTLTQSPP